MQDEPEPASFRLGGLYEQTGLYEGPVTSWGRRLEIILAPCTIPEDVVRLYARICEDLHPMQAHYGPEGATTRPRPQDCYWAVWADEHLYPGRSCGDGRLIGFAWTQAPNATTRTYAFGFFPECRRHGLGVSVKEALIARAFAEVGVNKVECDVYSCNVWSLRVLHAPDDSMKLEGIQRATIQVGGVFYDRHLFGLTREEWENNGNSSPPADTVRDMSG